MTPADRIRAAFATWATVGASTGIARSTGCGRSDLEHLALFVGCPTSTLAAAWAEMIETGEAVVVEEGGMRVMRVRRVRSA